MNQEQIFQKVQTCVSTTLKVPIAQVQPSARLVEDLNVDSLFITQLALELEEEFDIPVDENDLPNLITVQSVVDFVTQKLGAK